MPLCHHVFYAGQLYESYTAEEWEFGKMFETPDGAYVLYSNKGVWYRRQWSSFTPLNLCDVPADLKLMALLLNLITQ